MFDKWGVPKPESPLGNFLPWLMGKVEFTRIARIKLEEALIELELLGDPDGYHSSLKYWWIRVANPPIEGVAIEEPDWEKNPWYVQESDERAFEEMIETPGAVKSGFKQPV